MWNQVRQGFFSAPCPQSEGCEGSRSFPRRRALEDRPVSALCGCIHASPYCPTPAHPHSSPLRWPPPPRPPRPLRSPGFSWTGAAGTSGRSTRCFPACTTNCGSSRPGTWHRSDPITRSRRPRSCTRPTRGSSTPISPGRTGRTFLPSRRAPCAACSWTTHGPGARRSAGARRWASRCTKGCLPTRHRRTSSSSSTGRSTASHLSIRGRRRYSSSGTSRV
jgi:hypothetical protein